MKLGLLRHLAADRFEHRSPRLAEAASELSQLGIGIERQLELLRSVRKDVDGIAETYARFFVEDVWRPFVAAGQPESDLPRVREAFERLRPLVGTATMALFGIAMDDAVDRHFGHEVERLGKRR